MIVFALSDRHRPTPVIERVFSFDLRTTLPTNFASRVMNPTLCLKHPWFTKIPFLFLGEVNWNVGVFFHLSESQR